MNTSLKYLILFELIDYSILFIMYMPSRNQDIDYHSNKQVNMPERCCCISPSAGQPGRHSDAETGWQCSRRSHCHTAGPGGCLSGCRQYRRRWIYGSPPGQWHKILPLIFGKKLLAAAQRNMYLDANGNVIPGKSENGHLAAGVPGSVAGIFAYYKYARLPFSKLIQPAIDLAEKGFAHYRSRSA